MQLIHVIVLIGSLVSITDASDAMSPALGQCLRDLANQELSNSYNYLQLSSRFGTVKAFPGFSAFFAKLSDKDSSKSFDLVKFLSLRKAKLDRLVSRDGIKVRSTSLGVSEISQGLNEAISQNKEAWNQVMECHKQADNYKDANAQDYLESHLLEHHVEIDKLLTDIEHRLRDGQPSEKKLIMFMIDEELLRTYGDRRKDIFS